jgi:hypothetical protein
MPNDELMPTRMPDGEIRMMSQPKHHPMFGKRVAFAPGDLPADGYGSNGASEYLGFIVQTWSDPNDPNPYFNLYVIPPFGEPRFEGSCQEGEGPRTFRVLD